MRFFKNFCQPNLIKGLLLLFLTGLMPVPAQIPAYRDANAKPDTTAIVADTATVKPPLIKRDLHPTQQLKIGTGIMLFIVVVMAFSNNFNPD